MIQIKIQITGTLNIGKQKKKAVIRFFRTILSSTILKKEKLRRFSLNIETVLFKR